MGGTAAMIVALVIAAWLLLCAAYPVAMWRL
jgi:hypothetical protein